MSGTPSAAQLNDLYICMLRIRAFEQKVGELFARAMLPRQSHLYIGEEAVAAGACAALRPDDYITSTHRGHGHLIAKGGALRRMFAELAGRQTGYCKGKGGTMHIADLSLGMLGAISIVGGGIPIAVGSGLSARLRGTDQVTVCFFGDGAANTGNFHEGTNMAAIWKLPVVFVCENNQYNEYVAMQEVTAGPGLAERAQAYGMPGYQVDGNDVLAVYEAVEAAVQRARQGQGPTLVECITYRLVGHSTADPGTGYRTAEEVALWRTRDPIPSFRAHLQERGVLSDQANQVIVENVEKEVTEALEFALNGPVPDPEELMTDIFAPSYDAGGEPGPIGNRRLSYREAIREAMREEMKADSRVILIGEDVGGPGGVFKVTQGLLDEFGPQRVFDTPISENTIAGTAIGAAMTGLRPICEIMFMDLMPLCLDQVVNLGAKIRYMTGGQATVPAVIRVPTGGGLAAGATHSQSLEAYLYHTPGLKLVMPSTPYDAKGLLKTAIREDNLVIFLELKSLYNTTGPVPDSDYTIPLGVAAIRRPGRDVTVVATGAMVEKAMSAAKTLATEGIEVEVIDPRTLVPLDMQTILTSVRKTKHLVTFEEACRQGSVGADITATVTEAAFDYLDAPPQRIGALHAPIPFAPTLEQQLLPGEEDLIKVVRDLTRG